jgi:hypothetical protein
MSDTINTAGNMPTDVMPVWDHIWSGVVELHWFWRFHVDLCGNAEHVTLMRAILRGPFMFIRTAVLSHITMGIGRLLDYPDYHKRANLSFAHLLETLKPHASLEFSAKMTAMLDSADAHCQPLMLWRDKRFGHADKDHVLGIGPARLPEVEQEAVEKALALLRDLLTEIHGHFNGPDTPMPFPERVGDADCLMKYIRDGYDAERERIAELFP